MSTVQVASSVPSVPSAGCQNKPDCPPGKDVQPAGPDLQRNSLVSEEPGGSNETLIILREQLRSSVSNVYAPTNGIGAVTCAVSEERCSTPIMSHQAVAGFRSVGHSLSTISSPIPRQASSLPCSPRNGLTVIQSLNAGQMTSPVQRQVSSSSAHPSSAISSYTSPSGGSSVFAPMSAVRPLMASYSTPATPAQYKTAMQNLSPLGVSAAHVAPHILAAGSDSMASPSTSPRPGILRKRNNDGVPKTVSSVTSSVTSVSAATKLENSLRNLPATGVPSATSSPAPEPSAPARKKPRKQSMVTTEDPLASNVPPAESKSGSSSACSTPAPATAGAAPALPSLPTPKDPIQQFPFRKRMPANYGTGYKATAATGSKATINHFQRSSDVRVKEEKRQTLTELATQRSRLHDLRGWKVNTFVGNISTLERMERNKIDIVNSYLDQLPSSEGLDKKAADELHMITELLKGNLQRSKVLVEQLMEAKSNLNKVLEHRPQVVQLFNKFSKPAPASSKSAGSGSSSSGSNSKRKNS